MSKLDLLLVNAPSAYPGSMLSHRIQGLPPLGLGYIATYLKKQGYNIQILDFYIRTVTLVELNNILKEKNPPVVGISTTTETYKCGIRIAEFIKNKWPHISIVMGGCHVSFEYEEALQHDCIDYVIRNEGEITFSELMDILIKRRGNLEEIDGLCYKNQGKVIVNRRRKFIENLDTLPFPDRSFFDMEAYSVPGSISTSRGCPGNCIFCAATALSGGRYRTRSAENIVSEFEYLRDLGCKHIQIIDDTMTADINRLNEFLNIMIQKKIGVSWNCESRVDIMTKDLMERMKEAGCISIQFGVEAGSQEMLDCLKKNVTIEQIENVFTWAKELRIATATCLIIGQPYDTFETIDTTVKFAKRLQELGAHVVFSVSTPYPGTYMYNHPDKLGLEILDKDLDNYTTQVPVYNTSHLSLEEIRGSFFDAFVSLGKGKMDKKVLLVMNNMRRLLKSEIVEGENG